MPANSIANLASMTVLNFDWTTHETVKDMAAHQQVATTAASETVAIELSG
jgi:hypothetical protein